MTIITRYGFYEPMMVRMNIHILIIAFYIDYLPTLTAKSPPGMQ